MRYYLLNVKKYLLLGCVLLAGCAKQDEGWFVTIKGNVRFPNLEGSVYLQQLNIYSVPRGAKHIVDVDDNGDFNMTLDMKEPHYYRLNFYNCQQVDLVIDRSDLEINVDGSKPSGFIEIKGSPDRELLQRAAQLLRDSEQSSRAKALVAEIQDTLLGKERVNEIREEYMEVMYQGYDKVAALLERQAPSVQVVEILMQGWLTYSRHPELYVHVAKQLNEQWPRYTITKEFMEVVEKLKKLGIGQLAPEIALPDRNGELVKLSSFRGKYVLVDFWASWCKPCRRENPNVVHMYNRYHNKGFEVLGISLGKNKEKWLQAVLDDGLTWIQVSDLKSFDSPVVDVYQISSIPSSVLVDPEGLILAKNLRGSGLRDQLHTIFGY